jgi:AcrR family transcriptional regulator
MAGRPEEAVVVPTGRHGLPADIVAEHQRARLLAATIELVARRGYRGTSIDHIVKGAKVGYVAFYELFEGKEDCFLAAFEQIVTDTRAALNAGASAEASWPEQICSGLRTLIELVAAEPGRARVALVEVQAAGPRALARYEAALDSAAPKLREGRTLGENSVAMSDTLEEAVLGGIAWIVQQRLVKGEAEKVPGVLGEAIEIALSPYLGEAQARRLARATSQPRVAAPTKAGTDEERS